MYIRRKVFSRFVDESGEERLFSTIDYTLMSEAEQREFSKDKSEDEDDGEYLREDKRAIKRYKKHPEKAQLREQALKGDPEAKKKLGKKGSRAAMAILGTEGALLGGIIGGQEGGKKGALKGAAIGAAAGTGLGALTSREIKRRWKNVDKKSRDAQIEVNRELEKDRLSVANGNMTKKEFIKKWGGK